MGIAHKLLWLTVSVSAIMALGAVKATAVEVLDEATEEHCAVDANVAEDGASCQVRFEASDLEFGLPFGGMTVCDLHLEGDINEAGHMVADVFNIEPECEAGSNDECTDTSQHRHPEVTLTGPESGGASPIEISLCWVSFLGQVECHLGGTIVDIGTHDYFIRLVHTTKCENNPSYSFQGDIVLVTDAGHSAVEIR